VGVDLVKIVTNEATLVTVGTDSGSARHGLAELLVKRTALNRLQTLQVAGGRDVEAANEVVQDCDEEASNQETGCNRRDQDDNRDYGEEATGATSWSIASMSLEKRFMIWPRGVASKKRNLARVMLSIN
jgi:hypothetical protein